MGAFFSKPSTGFRSNLHIESKICQDISLYTFEE